MTDIEFEKQRKAAGSVIGALVFDGSINFVEIDGYSGWSDHAEHLARTIDYLSSRWNIGVPYMIRKCTIPPGKCTRSELTSVGLDVDIFAYPTEVVFDF